jgi:hypothetical protein
MNVIELMILYKLDNFRERMNRDRFILPEDKDISFFTKVKHTPPTFLSNRKSHGLAEKEMTEPTKPNPLAPWCNSSYFSIP